MTGRGLLVIALPLAAALFTAALATGCGADEADVGASSADVAAEVSDSQAAELPVTADVTGTPDACTDTCESAGWVCGSVCGIACGACGAQEACEDGACVCAPSCPKASCGQADSCGGTCPACDTLTNCQDCPLQLTLFDIETGADGVRRGATVALDYLAPEHAPRPRTADLQFVISGPVRLLAVEPGDALVLAGKGLYQDADTGKPWVERDDDVVQVVVLSVANTNRIEPGRLLTIQWLFGPEAFGDPAPVVISVVARSETFAPPDADAYLGVGGYDAPIVLWP